MLRSTVPQPQVNVEKHLFLRVTIQMHVHPNSPVFTHLNHVADSYIHLMPQEQEFKTLACWFVFNSVYADTFSLHSILLLLLVLFVYFLTEAFFLLFFFS